MSATVAARVQHAASSANSILACNQWRLAQDRPRSFRHREQFVIRLPIQRRRRGRKNCYWNAPDRRGGAEIRLRQSLIRPTSK